MMEHDDQFLYRLRQPPRAEFAADLWQRLAGQERRRQMRTRRLAVTLLTAWLALGFVFAASPEVRAQLEDFVQRVTHLQFGDVTLHVVQGPLNGTATDRSIPTVDMPIEDAQTVLPFVLPGWAPEGFVQRPDVHVVYYSENEIGMAVFWDNADSRRITLSIMNQATPQPVAGAGYQGREVEIGASTGLVYVGAWEPTTNQFGGDQINVVWAYDGLAYFLSAEGTPEDDLIHMARSQPMS